MVQHSNCDGLTRVDESTDVEMAVVDRSFNLELFKELVDKGDEDFMTPHGVGGSQCSDGSFTVQDNKFSRH